MQEPEPLLRKRKWKCAVAIGARDARTSCGSGTRLLDLHCHLAQRLGGRTWRRSGSSTAKLSRMRETSCVASSEWPPRSKKLSCRPIPLAPQHLLPEPASTASLGLAWLRAARRAARSPPPRGSRARSTLPFGVSGSARAPRCATAPCSPAAARAAAARSAAASSRRSPPLAPRTRPAAVADRRSAAQHHRGLAHRAMLPQRGFDLAELDAEAAQLDLMVARGRGTRASPSAQPAHQVAGAVEPPAGSAERVGDEPLGGQLGPVEIAARQPVAADVQLARPRRSAPARSARRARTPACWRSAGRSGRRLRVAPHPRSVCSS